MANSRFTFRTPTFEHLPPEKLGLEIDRHLPRLFDAHALLNATAVKAPRFGSNFASTSGNEIITGTKTVVTGLSSIDHVTASVSTSGVPNAYTLSCDLNKTTPGSVDISIFQPTAAGNTTPILATAAVLVHWIATGQAETTT